MLGPARRQSGAQDFRRRLVLSLAAVDVYTTNEDKQRVAKLKEWMLELDIYPREALERA
jgi:hypothetical protein